MAIFTSVHVTEADEIVAKVKPVGRPVMIWLGSDVALTFPVEPDKAELVLLRLAEQVDKAVDYIRVRDQQAPESAEQPVPGWDGAGASVEAQRG